jgi:hypothetical protein
LLFAARRPPAASIALSWRELYLGGAFGQRELVEDGRLRSAAQERGLQLGIGHETLERLDLIGAFSPVAFAEGGYWSGFQVPSHPIEAMSFREEREPAAWQEYAWEHYGHDNVTALFSRWQLLYADDVLRGATVELGIETLLLPPDQRSDQLERLRGWFEGQQTVLRSLHESWSPATKLLVALQNRYLRRFTESFSVVGVPGGGWVFAGGEWAEQDAEALLGRLGCSTEEVTALYEFLIERGLAHDPNDGLTLVRRARPRMFHKRWRGDARRAQDNFDAAEVLRGFLVELGEAPGRPDSWPMDGRQLERFALYDRGPAAPWTYEELKHELEDVELYPGGLHVICEGESEETVVQRLTEALLGSEARHELRFYDLEGTGSAKRVGPLARSFSEYARRAVVIVDNEGQMARYLETAIENGQLDEADVMLFSDSLEGDNVTPVELIGLARQIAENPPPDREAVAFELSEEELLAYHTERREQSSHNDKPGIASSLIVLVRGKTGLEIGKPELAEAVANMLVEEIESAAPGELEAVAAHRPAVRFFLERIAPVLNRPRPVGAEI